eukprot:TRINITY_DN24042_c0_g1_i5.p1 TRINITY_DN24042_c0_g1~~TRINITY_DN24042_c0_g1_i5.p1  ORF type:complete len:154 (+),score=29.34 TRINITY_DN24042_c0_g1_i5:111-572(+)
MSDIKQNKILITSPTTHLTFQGPFTQHDAVTATMKLRNPTQKSVCFRLKSTAPRRYWILPCNGVLEPHGETDVMVSLQPGVNFDPLLKKKNQHKVLIQSMFAPEEEGEFDLELLMVSEAWTMDTKLKCVFEMPVKDEKVPLKQEIKEEIIGHN